MAPISAWFFDSINGDRSYSSQDFSKAFDTFLETGIIPNINGYYGFTVSGTNFNILSDGNAVIEGHFVNNPVSEAFEIPAGTYNGLIVLRLDKTGERNCTVQVRKDRVPQQDSRIYEFPLYEANVVGGIVNSVVDVRTGGGALSQNTSQLKGVTDIPIVLKGYQQKSWSLQRKGGNYLYFVPSASVAGEDWDYTSTFHITDAGAFIASSSGFVNGNFDVKGVSYFRGNVSLIKDESGATFKVVNYGDDAQFAWGTNANGTYIDAVTSSYATFKKLNIRASSIETNCYFISTGQETGWCGIGARVLDNVTNSVAGVGVNFRQVRKTAPSSITLTKSSSNADPAQITSGMITTTGFWLSINGNNSGLETYLYWRGNYTTNN